MKKDKKQHTEYQQFKLVVLFIFFLLACFPEAKTQPFAQAPKLGKPVKKIVEWVQTGKNKAAEKGGVSHFNRQGLLTSYEQSGHAHYKQTFTYDKKGRLIKEKEGIDSTKIVSTYVYNPTTVVKEITYRGKTNREVDFYKNGLLVEEKDYSKGMELGGKYNLRERKLYIYNDKDSLVGETHYIYPMNPNGTPMIRKVVHEYDPKTSKRIITREFDYDKKERIVNDFSYRKDGQPLLVSQRFKNDNTVRTIAYKYKGNELWQVIDTFVHRKSVSIYKDNRLIRRRIYMSDEVFSIIDYQYVFYD